MKEILSSQFNEVYGGWADKDGSGHRSAENGGSRSGGNSGNDRGSPSLLDRTVSAYHNNPYGSGSIASGIWGGSMGSGSGSYSGNGPGSRGRELGGKNH
ncbi:hypothetical protein E2L00_03095 [Cedecea colo]|uniref:Colicin-E9 n=1 Tax=Cedecea colo TaxID=2552946 RepID=A0ABX0VHP0_9ENTR|nr:hypothetical protein [Cedecea colo]